MDGNYKIGTFEYSNSFRYSSSANRVRIVFLHSHIRILTDISAIGQNKAATVTKYDSAHQSNIIDCISSFLEFMGNQPFQAAVKPPTLCQMQPR